MMEKEGGHTITRGTAVRVSIGTDPIMLSFINPDREGLYLEADSGNAGTIFVNFDDPKITSTGDSAGIPLTAGQSMWDRPPGTNQGSVWAIASQADQTLIFQETQTQWYSQESLKDLKEKIMMRGHIRRIAPWIMR